MRDIALKCETENTTENITAYLAGLGNLLGDVLDGRGSFND